MDKRRAIKSWFEWDRCAPAMDETDAPHRTGEATGEWQVRAIRRFPRPTRPRRASTAYVTNFEPCARRGDEWHTHPLGQTLVVTFGCGLQPNGGAALSKK